MSSSSTTQIEGIIIRAFPSGESDLVLRVVSRGEGKVSVLAKHARKSKKRFGSRLDLFDRGLFEIRVGRGSLPVVEKFSPGPGLKNLREDLARITIASALCESFDALLLEGAGDGDDLFSLLGSGLERLNDSQTLKESLRACYETLSNLLALSGFLDSTLAEAPSAHALIRLMAHIEECAEKELQSKASLLALLDDLRRR